MLNVVTVNNQNYLGRGLEYVEKLRAGVERNLRLPHQFIVIDNVDAEGWWAKLAMFEPGRFTGRCLGLDLDTLITGSIDDIGAYQGSFAGLSDFLAPARFASGVMAWDAGEADHIWTKWVEAEKPSFHPMGDGAWIAAMMPEAKRLQDVFPGQLVSLKAHCGNGLPDNARVVCFHGHPRPHMLAELMAHW